MKLHVGASRIRKIALALPARDAEAFLRVIWPELSPRQAELIVAYPDETTCSGAYLITPPSWAELER